ncbi:LacI family DNA-binding transcriptional regulator [Goodfellowiella coeruleoviolacea]|uniref:LacI family DNA-binding transcriptional regulator n=1 Tax=Goodfellowiella coeruleoviolacea TaxID=334858 RepID=UPI0020A45A31|nr:LacI family DNA-binding transcriptional regulator [Goodfellowiella coeruleoviolacea]
MSDAGRPRPTLEEVAAAAGVSRGTASRVVNGSEHVSQSAKTAVLDAIARLGYVPNLAARSLVTRRADSIALVVSEPESRVFSEPFFAGLLRGVSQELAGSGLQLVLVMAWTTKEHDQIEQYVRNGHVDGVLLVSVHGDDPLPRRLVEFGAPVMMAGRPLSADSPISFVDCDNVGGAQAATNHLYAQGRRRIAAICGPPDLAASVDRLTGYRAALRNRRSVPRDLVAAGDFSLASGEHAMATLLERDPHLDAVFAASDPMAIGALRALRAAGRRVPDDVAVIGFDNSEAAAHTEPPLTSVHQPVSLMGRELVRALLEQIATGRSESTRTVRTVLPTELIIRESA